MNIIQENYRNLKRRYPQHILLYRKGRFYHAYGEDANAIDATRIPERKVEKFIGSLLERGYKVAVAEGVKVNEEGL